jgi:hypothetical protein
LVDVDQCARHTRAHNLQLEGNYISTLNYEAEELRRQSFSAKGMLQFLDLLAHVAEDKCVALEIERGVATVNGAMMVRANQHEIAEIVTAATAEPADVMSLA